VSHAAAVPVTRPAPARTTTGVLRRCACGGKAPAGGECAGCRAKRLQRSVPAAGSAAGPASAPPIVHDVLRSSGAALDASTRAYMEPRFGHSFADVRVHADGQAAESAAAVGAHAYAIGRDVVFGAGKYAPASADGRRLIAHELAHVVQQRGSASTLSPSLEVGPVDAPEEREAEHAAGAVAGGGRAAVAAGGAPALRRVPGKDAQESWDALVEGVEVRDADKESRDTAGRRARADEAVKRMLQTASGQKLANQLYAAFCKKDRCRTKIRVVFADRVPGNEAGLFEPSDAGAPRYTVYVKHVFPPTPGAIQLPGGCWPDNKAPATVCYSYADPASDMANTLYHESLHVWFVNTQGDSAIYPTGHMDVNKGEIDPLFLKKLREMSADLDALEKKIHAEEAKRKAQQAPAAPPESRVPLKERDVEGRAEPREPANPAGERLVGGEVSLHAGGAGGGGLKSFSGIVGADLILGNIHQLRLGARGVYLTPGHVLAGGTVGTRILEGGGLGGKVENPLFFDVEAGVLAELAPGDAGRFTDNVAGFASAGVGQEYGTQGARFFWRVSGFVIVSDRAFKDMPETPSGGGGKPVAGGGAAGVGVRF